MGQTAQASWRGMTMARGFHLAIPVGGAFQPFANYDGPSDACHAKTAPAGRPEGPPGGLSG